MLNLMIPLRSILRKLGLTRFLVKYLYPSDYEKHFDNSLLQSIAVGDIVWDVGANIGFYTTKFSDAVSYSGSVVAFEPITDTFEILKEKVKNLDNVALFQIALGESDQALTMSINHEVGSPTNKILSNPNGDAAVGIATATISVRSADSIIEEFSLDVPNVIKIDVEGYEGYVIKGMSSLLDHRSVKIVAMEIHFAILEENGDTVAVSEITKLLVAKGFSLKWTDPSHIIASRA